MFQSKLKMARKEKKITLEQLSKKTGLSVGYLCHLENGTRTNPSIYVMEKIAEVLEKEISDLFFSKD